MTFAERAEREVDDEERRGVTLGELGERFEWSADPRRVGRRAHVAEPRAHFVELGLACRERTSASRCGTSGAESMC